MKALVAAHVFAITVWTIPAPPDAVQEGKRGPKGTDWLLVWNDRYLKSLSPLQAYLFSTGFWQYWDMFAPNPAQTDFYSTADVKYRDGKVKLYRYPRIRDFPILMKYPKERYRKFFERVHPEDDSWLWPYFAQRIALLNAKDPDNPPVSIRLHRHWLPVSPPGTPQPEKYFDYIFYEHKVDLDKLRRDLAGR